MPSKILLVVEGERTEPKLIKHLLESYDLGTDYEIVPYRTNIYVLYGDMFANGEDAEMLSIQDVLKERETKQEMRDLLDQDYSDVLLVFDYEPQDPQFDPSHLVEMQRHFNESTDEGKLFINYPMVEACRHFFTIPDPDFIERAVGLDDGVPGYKAIVGRESCCNNVDELAKDDFDRIIAMILEKGLRICGKSCDFANAQASYEAFSLNDLLDVQNQHLATHNEVWVLGTCLLFICDYSIELVDFSR